MQTSTASTESPSWVSATASGDEASSWGSLGGTSSSLSPFSTKGSSPSMSSSSSSPSMSFRKTKHEATSKEASMVWVGLSITSYKVFALIAIYLIILAQNNISRNGNLGTPTPPACPPVFLLALHFLHRHCWCPVAGWLPCAGWEVKVFAYCLATSWLGNEVSHWCNLALGFPTPQTIRLEYGWMPGLELRKVDQQELVKTSVLSKETNSRKKETLDGKTWVWCERNQQSLGS